MLSNMLDTTLSFNNTDFNNFKVANTNYEASLPRSPKVTTRTTYNTHTDYAYSNHSDTNPHSDGYTANHTDNTKYDSYSYHSDSHSNSNKTHSDRYRYSTTTHYNTNNKSGKHYDSSGWNNKHFDSTSTVTAHSDGNAHWDKSNHSNYSYHSDSGSSSNKHSNTSYHNDYNTSVHNQYTYHSQYSTPMHTQYNPHTDTGFYHSNYVPSSPAVFNVAAAQKIKGTTKIGLSSYDKDGGVVKYHLAIKKVGSSTWTTLMNWETTDTYSLNTLAFSEGDYDIRAIARNDPMSGGGVTTTFQSAARTVRVEIKQNEESTVSVINSGEVVNFTFGDHGVNTPSDVFKEYSEGIYATNPSGQTEGILLRINMSDADVSQYQKGKVELLTTTGAVINTKEVIWSNGSTVIQSAGGVKTGYVFIPDTELAGKEQAAKFRVRIYEYEEASASTLVSNTTVIDTISKTNTTPLNLKLDFVVPNISINYTTGVTTYVKRANANITVSDGLSGVRKVEYQWTKSGVSPLEADWVGGSASMSTLSPDGAESGTYQLHVRATDKAGNTKVLNGGVVKIDNTAPGITVTPNTATTYEKVHTPVITTEDNHSGVGVRQYQWTTSPTFPTGGTWSNFGEGVGVNTPTGVSGDYYLHVKVIDNSGNISTHSSEVFKLDNEASIITFNPLTNPTYEREQDTTVIVTDAKSGVKTSKYMWTASTATPASGTWTDFVSGDTITIDSVTGNRYLHIRVEDNSGNITDSSSDIFRLDNTKPSLVITGNPTVLTPPVVTLSVAGSDTHSGISKIRLASTTELRADAIGDWVDVTGTGGVYSYPLEYNGEYYFEAMDKAGNIITSADDPNLKVEVTKMNFEVLIDDLTITNNKQVINHLGKDTYVMGRSDFVASVEATMTDDNLTDELHYDLEFRDSINALVGKETGKILGTDRVGIQEVLNINKWLVDASSNNWSDGLYTLNYTVKDYLPGYGDLSERSASIQMLILRAKPPTPVITVDTANETASVDFPEHPILQGGLENLLTTEYAVGSSSYVDYTGDIDLSGITEPTSIYAKYTDVSGNYAVAILNYIPEGDVSTGGTEITTGEFSSNKEETRTSVNTYINTRHSDEDKLDKEVFDFLD